MCGIAGFVSFSSPVDAPEARLKKMCDAMTHRGPDDFGSDVRQGVALGMRRLSIIDVSGGHQPIFNEDRSVRVVFNGEIYNYRELRRELEAEGHRFSSNSDTEVIVHLWEKLGSDFASRLNGMFAIALHDLRGQTLVLARDHVGIKPLFYSLSPHGLVFGSEIKVLLSSGLIDRELDVDALGQLLAWEYIPGEGTLLKSIRKLKAGHLLELDLASTDSRLVQFWDVPLAPAEDSGGPLAERDWEEIVDQTIHEAVQRQLVSDVPLGAFLSGGVDSSLVVAGMGAGAHAFSIGFDDSTYNELPWARRVAEHLHVKHSTDVLSAHVEDLFDRLMPFMDDPIGDFSIFPTYLVSRHARREVTVALSGDGGDELFGGYETYLAQEWEGRWNRIPRLLRSGMLEPAVRRLPPQEAKKGLVNKALRFVEGLEHDHSLGHARWRLFVGEAMRKQLFTPEALRQMPSPVDTHLTRLATRTEHLSDVDRALYLDFKSYLVDNCLVKMDRMSMAVSLEARVPLLDKEVVELAFRVPSRLKVNSGKTKILLKRIASRHVPEECVYRPKEGFSIPIKTWLKAECRPLMEDLLSTDQLGAEGIFDASVAERLKQEHLSNRANHSHILWTMMVFQDWRRRWKV
ncbi:MAG: asparagine synthase (glutamine-hydrolyzing) [Acidobacteriota bacterium]